MEERLVGAVLGPAGRYVEEIKQYRSNDMTRPNMGVLSLNLIFGNNL